MGKKMKKSEKKKSLKKEEISNKEISEDNNNNNDKINKSFKGSEDLNYKDLSRILENDLTKNISPDEIINNKEYKSNDSLYKSLQNNYLKNTLNINLISMITKLIKTSTTIPKELKANYPLNSILMEIVKEFMLTDLEIVYLSLYLDIYGWES